MPDRTDISAGMAGGKQVQSIKLRYGKGGEQIQHIKEAGFIGLYPFEFAADLTGDFRSDRGTAFIGGLYAGNDFLVRRIFEHIITYAQLESGKNQFIVLINGKDYDFDIRQ